jgi:hypothetical protein
VKKLGISKSRHLVTSLCAAVWTLICVKCAPAVVFVGQIYDENAVQTNQVDVSATAFTVGQMTSAVASAFSAGRGGVIDFDNGTFTDSRTIDARFAGASFNKSLRLTSGVRDWQIGVLGTSSSSGSISGPNVIFLGAPAPFPNPFANTIVFGDVTDVSTNAVLPERVTSFGMTIIDANFNGSGNNVHFDVSFSNGTATSTDFFIPLAFQTNDTFFGWSAPANAYITQISFTATNNTAGEDWAFITSPVPEPASVALLAIGAVGTLLMRRRYFS